MNCASREDSDQPGHPPCPNLIRAFTVCMKKPWVLDCPLSAKRWLIRQGRCPIPGHTSFCWFCHASAQIVFKIKFTQYIYHCDIELCQEMSRRRKLNKTFSSQNIDFLLNRTEASCIIVVYFHEGLSDIWGNAHQQCLWLGGYKHQDDKMLITLVAMLQENVYSEVCNQVRFRRAYSAIEASKSLWISVLATKDITLSR